MAIVVTSTPNTEVQAPSAEADKAPAAEPVVDAKSSAEAQGEQTEETTEVESQETTTDGESESEGAEAQETEEKPKKKSGIQRLKERHAREMSEIRREIESIKAQDPKGQRQDEAQVSVAAEDKPQSENYDTHEKFVEALTDWKLEQRERKDQQQSKEAQAKNAYETQMKSHNERIAKFRKATPEYDQAIEDFVEEHGDVRFSGGLQQAVFESDLGPALILELVKSPDELMRINSLSLTAAAREIGKIEERIAARASAKPKPKQTTKAPAPIEPVNGSTSPAKSIFEAQTQAEFESIRRKEMSKRSSSW